MDEEQLRAAYAERSATLERACSRLLDVTTSAVGGLDHRHIDRVSFRVKGIDSFVDKVIRRKADPPYADPLAEVEDQIAGRVIVFFPHDIEPVLAALHDTFNRVEQKHRHPEDDDAFGYESHHMIAVIPAHLKGSGWESHDSIPNTFELQVRTIFMHAYAEPQHDFGYKPVADLTRRQRRELAWVAASAWGGDQALERLYEVLVGEEESGK